MFLFIPEVHMEVISPVPDGEVEVDYEKPWTIAIEKYLESRGSPLASHAESFVGAGEEYGVESAALVAIAGVESGLGRAFLCGDHNPFGYGRPCVDFGSYDRAIYRVAKTIGTSRYYRKYQESRDPRDLAGVYCACDEEAWLRSFNFFIKDLERSKLTYVR